MKELRFRAWDRLERGLRHVQMIDFDKEVVWLVEELSPDAEAYQRWISDVDLMQYIGIEDNDKVEICQSDILAIDFGRGLEHCIVKYFGHDYYPAFDVDGDFIPDSNGLSMVWFYQLPCRIIGNIHENPELITPQQLAELQAT